MSPKQLLLTALVMLCLVCVSGCCTRAVYDMGLASEVRPELVSVCCDDEAQVIEILYKVALDEKDDNGLLQEGIIRKLTVPYDHLSVFELCTASDLDAAKLKAMQSVPRSARFSYGPKGRLKLADAIQPRKVLDTTPIITEGRVTGRYLDIVDSEREHSYDWEMRVFTADAIAELKSGKAVYGGWGSGEILLPWRDKILFVGLPARNGHHPWAIWTSIPLYPIAVAGDVITLPLQVVVVIVVSCYQVSNL